MNALFLLLSVLCGAGRSVFSKKMAVGDRGMTRHFYHQQSLFFLFCAAGTFFFTISSLNKIGPLTFLYGAAFGLTIFIGQWCYTLALSRGPTSLCAMIYSFGFLFPTLSGTLFWNEPFGPLSLIGLLLAIAAIVISAFSNHQKTPDGRGFLIPNLIAMVCSGGLGILQKMHQSSDDVGSTSSFLLLAFVLAAALAYGVSFLVPHDEEQKTSAGTGKRIFYPALAGGCFGILNVFNTTLAGRLPSAVLFPTLNIGVMMACLISGIVFFKEHPTKTQIVALGLGALSILVLTFSDRIAF